MRTQPFARYSRTHDLLSETVFYTIWKVYIFLTHTMTQGTVVHLHYGNIVDARYVGWWLWKFFVTVMLFHWWVSVPPWYAVAEMLVEIPVACLTDQPQVAGRSVIFCWMSMQDSFSLVQSWYSSREFWKQGEPVNNCCFKLVPLFIIVVLCYNEESWAHSLVAVRHMLTSGDTVHY